MQIILLGKMYLKGQRGHNTRQEEGLATDSTLSYKHENCVRHDLIITSYNLVICSPNIITSKMFCPLKPFVNSVFQMNVLSLPTILMWGRATGRDPRRVSSFVSKLNKTCLINLLQ